MNARHALAIVLVVVTTTVGMSAAPAAAAASAPTLIVAPEGGGVIHSGDDVTIDVTVTNPGTEALPAGSLSYSVDQAPVASSTTMLTQLAERITEPLGFRITTITAKVPALPAGRSQSVRATIPNTDPTLRGLIRYGNGARLLYVRYRAGAGSTATQTVGKSVVSYVASSFKGRVGFGTVIAVTAPASSTGIVDTDLQAQLTEQGGAWDAALRAARRSPNATIALDPAVLASIRLAGASAPGSVQDFLSGLESLPNQFIRLPYADADVTLWSAAGQRAPLLPPSSFAGASVVSVASPTDSPTPQPTPAGGQADPTSLSDLTQWHWSDQQVAWPVAGTASTADVAQLGAAGDTVLLGSRDIAGTADRAAGPLARIGSTRVLVADTTVSTLLATATNRTAEGEAALAELTGILATAAVTAETPALLGVAGRGADAAGLGRVIDLLERQPWVSGRSLAELATQSTTTSVKLAKTRVPAARIATARSLLAAERDVQDLGQAITQDAATITGPPRLALLGLLSAAWRGDDAGWAMAAGTASKSFGTLADKVSLVRGDDANAIGNDGHLLVTVDNALDQPVKVVIRASVSNGHLQFGGDGVTVVVPANARNVGRLLFHTITNGSSDVTLTLETPKGTRIGASVVRPVTVRAGFDTLIAIVLLTALGLLLALGVYRNVRRRKQPRAVAAA